MHEDQHMSDDGIRTGDDDVFAWDGEQIEPEAEALAHSIRTDPARAVREYDSILTGYRSVGYAAMVSSRAVHIISMQVLATPEMPPGIAEIVVQRIGAFILGSRELLARRLP